jgi:hypothetical protein
MHNTWLLEYRPDIINDLGLQNLNLELPFDMQAFFFATALKRGCKSAKAGCQTRKILAQ